MSLSQTMPPGYQSILYPNSTQNILPAELSHGTGGNSAIYMSKSVGGKRHHHRKTIIRKYSHSISSSSSRRKNHCKKRKTRKNHRNRK